MPEDTAIDRLASSLSAMTLEELRKGPNFLEAERSGPVLDSDFPPLPPAAVEKSHCYILGWLREEVATRMMKVAGPEEEVVPRGEPGYYPNALRALHYMREKSNYFHLWTSLGVMDGGPGTEHLVNESMTQRDDYAGLSLIAICCTVEEAHRLRPNKAQFEWFKQVMGKEPRWFSIKRDYYEFSKESLWKVTPCCPLGKGLYHLVDLETGEWKRD